MQLIVNYPDKLPDALQESAEQFEHEAKMAMAAKLYLPQLFLLLLLCCINSLAKLAAEIIKASVSASASSKS